VAFWIKRDIVGVRKYLADQDGSQRCPIIPSKHLSPDDYYAAMQGLVETQEGDEVDSPFNVAGNRGRT
jgi:hypothetical protein